MPSVRSLVSKRRTRVVAIILLLGEIILTYSYCVLKGLVYIVIISLLGRQPSIYFKCTKANIYLLYNMRLMSFNKYKFLRCVHHYIY